MGRFTMGPVERARALRRNATAGERHVWELVRNRRMLGLKFRRQHPIGRFVVDFYCAEHRLVVELDGPTHEMNRAYDRERDKWLEAGGYRVLRVPTEAVSEDLLRRWIGMTIEPPPSPRSGEGAGGEVRGKSGPERGVR